MTITMDDDGAILVHLTNPGGIVGGSGVANQIAYWTDTDTIGGDAGLTYNAATDTITVAGNILMADDKFIGITGDIRIEFDSSDGDIMFHLGDTAGADEVQIIDSGSNVVAYINSDGDLRIIGHSAFGTTASIGAGIVVDVRETVTANTGVYYGMQLRYDFWPTANFNTAVSGLYLTVNLGTAWARTGFSLMGMQCIARVQDGITAGAGATGLWLTGAQFFIDVEDAGAAEAHGIRLYTPQVDTGSCTAGYGIYIVQGFVNQPGGGSMTTLTGLRIDAMNEGVTSYAIYSAGGNSYHAGKVSIGGTVAPLAQLHVDQSSGSGVVPVLYLDQADVSEEMIEFACTIGAGNAIEAVGGKTLTTTHFIKVTLPGSLTRYIPVGTIA